MSSRSVAELSHTLGKHASERECAFQTASNAQPRPEKRGDRWASATPLNLQNSAGSATKRCGLDERGAGPAVPQTLVGVRKRVDSHDLA